MKRKIIMITLLAGIMLLSACGTQNDTDADSNERIVDTDRSGSDGSDVERDASLQSKEQETEVPTPTEEIPQEEMAGLLSLNFSLDEAATFQNAGSIGFNYLTVDEDGTIYWTDYQDDIVYKAAGDGSGKEAFCEGAGRYLQLSDGYLYYHPENGVGIMRTALDTRIQETVWDGPCGEFLLKDGRIYINGPQGFTVCDMDGSHVQVLFDYCNPVHMRNAGESILFIETADEDITLYLEGRLGCYSLETGEAELIEAGVFQPLPLGLYFVYQSADGLRHVLDTASGESSTLSFSPSGWAGTRDALYFVFYSEELENSYRVARWDFENFAAGENVLYYEVETLFEVPQTALTVPYLYITDQYLYLLQMKETGEEGTVSIWYYYDLSNGEIGEL